jgi:hypothetical protein
VSPTAIRKGATRNLFFKNTVFCITSLSDILRHCYRVTSTYTGNAKKCQAVSPKNVKKMKKVHRFRRTFIVTRHAKGREVRGGMASLAMTDGGGIGIRDSGKRVVAK